MSEYQMNEFPPNGKRVILLVALVFILIVGLFKVSVTVQGGESGVLFERFSGGINLDKTYGEGFHIIAPWNDMIIYEVRQQEVMEKMAVISSNGLEIEVEISLWYEPELSKLPHLHKEKGVNYLSRVIIPAIRSATRSVIGRYNPEEIYSSKRDAIQSEIEDETRKIISDQYVLLNRALVRDITLPPMIKTAIETKLKQEQESLEYDYKIIKAQKEKERQIIDAQGKAESNRILSASLNDKILKEKGIEATLELSRSPNSKVIIIGSGKSGMPIILGGQ